MGQGDKARGIGWQEEIAPSLKAEVNGNNPPAVVAYRIGSDYSYGMLSGNPNSGVSQVDVSNTIDASDQRPERHQGGIAIVSCYDARGNGGG